MECMNISSEELAKRLAAVKVGSRVMATQSGKYSFKRGVVTADEGSSFRVKFDETELGEYSIPKGKIVPLNARARNAKSKVKIFEREGARPIIREYDSLDAARAYAGLEYNQRIAKAPYGSFLIAVIGEDGFYQQLGGERWHRVSPAAIKAANANARACNSTNPIVRNAMNAVH